MNAPLSLNVHFLPDTLRPEHLADSTAIVVDVLRATTTIVHALAYGARAVIPTLEVDDALARSAEFDPASIVLGGERGGELIRGFHLDNSPLKYTADVVRDKTILFTTTNGTRALLKCANAESILVGAMVNLHAVAKAAAASHRSIQIVCAGTNGDVTSEDVLTAGAIVAELEPIATFELTDAARMARDLYAHHNSSPGSLLDAFFESRGGRNLKELGFDDDVERSAERDLFDAIPVFDPATGEIRTAREPFK